MTIKVPGARIDGRFIDTVYAIEATSFELHSLWREHSKEFNSAFHPNCACVCRRKQMARQVWERDMGGFAVEVSRSTKTKTMMSWFFYRVDGYRLGFYRGESHIVDYQAMDDWVAENLPTVNQGGALWGKCNADNFAHVIYEIERRERAGVLK